MTKLEFGGHAERSHRVRGGMRGAGAGRRSVRATCGSQRARPPEFRTARPGRAMGPWIIAGGCGGTARRDASGSRSNNGHLKQKQTNANHEAADLARLVSTAVPPPARGPPTRPATSCVSLVVPLSSRSRGSCYGGTGDGVLRQSASTLNSKQRASACTLAGSGCILT